MEEGDISGEEFKSRYRQLEGLINAASAQIDQMKSENGLDVDTALDYLSHLLWNAATSAKGLAGPTGSDARFRHRLARKERERAAPGAECDRS